MYVARATPLTSFKFGSTVLHEDVVCAVNHLLWATPLADGSPGYALWHIFTAADTLILRRFLDEEGLDHAPGEVIHSQSIYLTPDLLARLNDKFRVQPYEIRQYMGDTVYIPAGCAHQARHFVL